MTQLSVNINKTATVRNARGSNTPDIIKFALDCERFGAQGITVHPRPDERHIRYQDVYDLKFVLSTEFNIEGKPNRQFIKLVTDVVPAQVTLVPDADNAITSNAGWDTAAHFDFLKDVIAEFKNFGIRTSIFIDTDLKRIEKAKEAGTDRIELYTEPYAVNYAVNKTEAIAPFIKASLFAHEIGLGINAGHDLSLENLRYLKENLPYLDEVSIGHALICDALYYGIENTIQLYLKQLKS